MSDTSFEASVKITPQFADRFNLGGFRRRTSPVFANRQAMPKVQEQAPKSAPVESPKPTPTPPSVEPPKPIIQEQAPPKIEAPAPISVTESAEPTKQVQLPKELQNTDEEENLQTIFQSNDPLVQKYKSALTLFMLKYNDVKRHNERLLDHLEDARADHLAHEIQYFDSQVPKRSLFKEYSCNAQRQQLLACYRKSKPLECASFVQDFYNCSQEHKKSILDNQNL